MRRPGGRHGPQFHRLLFSRHLDEDIGGGEGEGRGGGRGREYVIRCLFVMIFIFLRPLLFVLLLLFLILIHLLPLLLPSSFFPSPSFSSWHSLPKNAMCHGADFESI